jgi:hypothetical protein
MVNEIKRVIISNNPNNNLVNIINVRVISFIIMYYNTFDGTSFNCWNNNYAGIKLNYAWGGINKYFDNTYLCLWQLNGIALPYASFATIDDTLSFMMDKLSPVSNIPLDAGNITDIILNNFGPVITVSDDEKAAITDKIQEALNLAKTLII